MTWRDWLKRLCFSFFIIAFACMWTAGTRHRRGDRGWGPAVLAGGAIACAVLGAAGLKLRHERPKLPKL